MWIKWERKPHENLGGGNVPGGDKELILEVTKLILQGKSNLASKEKHDILTYLYKCN